MIVRSLTAEEAAWRDLHLEYAEAMLSSSTQSIDALQSLYDRFFVKSEIEEAVICAIGLAFGGLLVRDEGYEWVFTEEDEFPPEIAVGVPDLKLVCHPISMIAKRLRDVEAWNLRELAAGTAGRLRALVEEAAHRKH